MCLLTIQTYKCNHKKARFLSTTYVLEGKVKVCHVEIDDALNRSCSTVVEYKCARCMGSLK